MKMIQPLPVQELPRLMCVDAIRYDFNTGGPRSRTRTERLTSTLLGDDTGAVRCPRVMRVGLSFGRCHPVRTIERLLKEAGFANAAEARAAMSLPPAPCLCRPDLSPTPLPAREADPLEVLRQALVLGLSTPFLYDPGRPLFWTRTNLSRCLELFEGEGFYA